MTGTCDDCAYNVYDDEMDEYVCEAYLDEDIFTDMPSVTMEPDPADVAGYEQFMTRYTAGLDIERKAVETMKE